MKLNARLAKLGFETADRAVRPRLILSLCGLEKQGKTHFALTAPGPLCFFDLDAGTEGVVSKFSDKDVWVKPVLKMAEGDDQDDIEREWDSFSKAYYAAFRIPEIRTIVLDTASEVWELLRLARFGRLTQVMPYQYGPVNKEYRQLLRAAEKSDKNLVLLHRMKAEYFNDKRTGRHERAGFSGTGFDVQVNARCYRYDADDGGEFALQVENCRQNPELAGMELTGDLCNYQMMASLALPDVDPSAWEG